MCAEAFPPLTARPRARARRGLCKLFVDAESFSGDMYKAQSDYDDLTLTLKQAEDQVALLEFEKQCDWCQPPAPRAVFIASARLVSERCDAEREHRGRRLLSEEGVVRFLEHIASQVRSCADPCSRARVRTLLQCGSRVTHGAPSAWLPVADLDKRRRTGGAAEARVREKGGDSTQ